MITILLTLNAEDCLVEGCLSGHAEMGLSGSDPVCAAVSILVRTLLLSLSVEPEAVDTRRRGFLQFSIDLAADHDRLRWRFATDFFLCGLRSLEQEYPQAVSMTVNQVSA